MCSKCNHNRSVVIRALFLFYLWSRTKSNANCRRLIPRQGKPLCRLSASEMCRNRQSLTLHRSPCGQRGILERSYWCRKRHAAPFMQRCGASGGRPWCRSGDCAHAWSWLGRAPKEWVKWLIVMCICSVKSDIASNYASPSLIATVHHRTNVVDAQSKRRILGPGVDCVGEFRCWKFTKITNLPAPPFTYLLWCCCGLSLHLQ
jgi:hypothetical protein